MFSKHKAYDDICGANDPRSVAAMLRGTGDGREKLYEAYAMKTRIQTPGISDEEIDRMYTQNVRDEGFAGRLKAVVALGRIFYHAIGVGAAFMALSYFYSQG